MALDRMVGAAGRALDEQSLRAAPQSSLNSTLTAS
jgi:hypothetical protein